MSIVLDLGQALPIQCTYIAIPGVTRNTISRCQGIKRALT
jgi:hypothetical protein